MRSPASAAPTSTRDGDRIDQHDRRPAAGEHVTHGAPHLGERLLARRKHRRRAGEGRVDAQRVRRAHVRPRRADRPRVDDPPARLLAEQRRRAGHEPRREHLEAQVAEAERAAVARGQGVRLEAVARGTEQRQRHRRSPAAGGARRPGAAARGARERPAPARATGRPGPSPRRRRTRRWCPRSARHRRDERTRARVSSDLPFEGPLYVARRRTGPVSSLLGWTTPALDSARIWKHPPRKPTASPAWTCVTRSTGTNFRFYDFEYQLALQFNGQPLRDVTVWASETYGVDLTVDGINEFAGRLSELGFLDAGGPAPADTTPGGRHESGRSRQRGSRVDVGRGREDGDVRSRRGDARFARRPHAGRARAAHAGRRGVPIRRRADGRARRRRPTRASRPTRPAAAPVRHPVARREGARGAERRRRPHPRRRRQRDREPGTAANAPAKPPSSWAIGPRRHVAIARRGARPGGAAAAGSRPAAADQKTPPPLGLGKGVAGSAAPPPACGPRAARPSRAPPTARARSRPDGGVLDGGRRGGGEGEAADGTHHQHHRPVAGDRGHRLRPVVPRAFARPAGGARARAVAEAGGGLPLVLGPRHRDGSRGTHAVVRERRDAGRAAAAGNGVRGGRHPGPAARRATDRGAADPPAGAPRVLPADARQHARGEQPARAAPGGDQAGGQAAPDRRIERQPREAGRARQRARRGGRDAGEGGHAGQGERAARCA